MSENKIRNGGELKFLLRGTAAWIITALILLLLAALLFSFTELSSAYMGYCSSAISFISSMAAGFAACRRENKGILYRGLITAAVITVCLLSVGFACKGPGLRPSAVLSLVSFTFSGLLLAAVMSPIIFPAENSRKSHIKLKSAK